MSIVITSSVNGSLTERVAAHLRALMGYRGMRQSQLARTLGVTDQWLSVRLRGVQPIDLNELERMVEALGIELADLFPKGEVTRREAGGNPVSGGVRPPDRRPPGHPSTHIPPSGLARSARSQPAMAA